jgi:hypothetical protein
MDRTVVFLDPDGTAGPEWMHVIVQAPTGVIYQQQYGGTATLLAEVEGYLVPVHDPAVLASLRSLFRGRLRGAGATGSTLSDELLDDVRRAISSIRFWTGESDQPAQLSVDEQRLSGIDEALVPIITPGGPGYLVWSNSD